MKAKLIREEDMSYHNVKRYVRRLVMTDNPKADDVEAAIRWQIMGAKLKHPFNALGFFVYALEGEVDGYATIAIADYAPNGLWKDAGTVKTGDYQDMLLRLEMV